MAPEAGGAELLGGGAPELDCQLADEEQAQLSRILQCKRLSEGCNRFNLPSYLARKNSLHSMMMQDGGSLLPPVTEGVPMAQSGAAQQQQLLLQQHVQSQDESSSASSLSLRSGSSCSGVSARQQQLALGKRHSHDDNTTSCSSSTSLDGKGSPTAGQLTGHSRRRSSTVSQCSSVLSEGTRQQLNFDLSPDLAPDSSINEANALSPQRCGSPGRPASPEPLSPSVLSDELRPVSRMSSQFCFDDDDDDDDEEADCQLHERMSCELPVAPSDQSHDSTLGESRRDDHHYDHHLHADQSEMARTKRASPNDKGDELRHEAQIRVNLERLISEVGTVKVSASNKRAHTPHGANAQRNKVAPFSAHRPVELGSPTPSPPQIGN